MAVINRNNVNPVNEALRKDVEGPPDLEEMLAQLIEKTSQIHAGYLFEHFGVEARRTLCQWLSATRPSLHYKGWEDFAIGLGLNHLQVKCIDNHFNLQDPVSYTLQAFVQKPDATIDKIITTLKNIERFDILNIIHNHFSQLADNVLRSQSNRGGEESGFSSMRSDSDYNSGEQVPNRDYIYRPALVPEVPDVLLDIRPNRELEVTNTVVDSDSMNSRIVTERYQTHSEETTNEVKTPIKYNKKVMLTFATDGLEIAREVANVFRRQKGSEQRVGVVILNDHLGYLNSNPQHFIFSCFDQVDYVVPIVTEGYVKAVSALSSDSCESSLRSIDPKYVRYIYTLMNTNYLQNNCLNDKVRCLVPDELTHLTHEKGLFRGPLFQAWYKLSDVAELKQRMLGSNI